NEVSYLLPPWTRYYPHGDSLRKRERTCRPGRLRLFPRVRFIVTNLTGRPRKVVRAPTAELERMRSRFQ
ncbi:MAG: hypothetical protein O7D94_00650, partial [Planctomycetota bacterium]|nr:hypothetical protein [Planctomycetota bacterium]